MPSAKPAPLRPLTARQGYLLGRLPSRPTAADLAAISDAGLRALLAANGLPRRRDDRRSDYASALLTWLATDPARNLAFPPAVERGPGGEPAPPAEQSSLPPPPTQSHPPARDSPPSSRSSGPSPLAPALSEVGATLRALLAAIRADHAAEDGVGGGAWALVGRAEAAAAQIAALSAAFDAGAVHGEALALARQQSALAAERAELAAARKAPPQAPQGGRRSWREVAAGAGPSGFDRGGFVREGAAGERLVRGERSGGEFRGRTWDTSRTIFLSPAENSFLRKNIDPEHFGRALGRVVGARQPGILVRTGAGLFKAELEKTIAEKILAKENAVEVPGFGVWRATRMRTPAKPSIVVSGVDPKLSDGDVTRSLIHGLRGVLEEGERGLLGSLEARRLFLGARRREGGQNGGVDVGA